jgi:RNA polymerase sigma factor (sigma-70 family)
LKKTDHKEVNLNAFKENTGLFLEYCDSYIDCAVRLMIFKGIMQWEDKQDVKQEVILHLIKTKDSICSQFKNEAKFGTYIMSVILNCIKRIKYLDRREPKTVSLNLIYHYPDHQNNLQIYLLDEFERLSHCLNLFGKKKNKLILSLKLIFRIPLAPADILAYFPEASQAEISELMEISTKTGDELKQKHIYDSIISLYNKAENRVHTADSLRKWMNSKLEEICTLLNSNGRHSNYDKESIQLLMEKYFMRNK